MTEEASMPDVTVLIGVVAALGVSTALAERP